MSKIQLFPYMSILIIAIAIGVYFLPEGNLELQYFLLVIDAILLYVLVKIMITKE